MAEGREMSKDLNVTPDNGSPQLTKFLRSDLELIVSCDPTFLLEHIKFHTSYNFSLLGKMIELAKCKATQLLEEVPETGETKEWILNLKREIMLSKMTHNFTFTRDEVIELLGGKFAILD
jgi:hypothetical protein